jgi:hypothetical protein
MRYRITFVTAALVTAGLVLTSVLAPAAYSAGAFNKGAGFAQQIFKDNKKRMKPRAGIGKKKP